MWQKIPPPQCDFHWQIDLLPWSSINAFRLALASMTQNGEWLLRKPERLLLEQKRQKARRSCSEVSRSAISWLLDERERSRRLLVSLCVGNALLGRNSILGSGESNSITQTNSDLLSKVCSSISKNKRISLQRSVQSMLSMVLPNFGCLLTSFSHFF